MFLPRNPNVFLVLGKTHHHMSFTLFYFYSRTSKCLWFRKKWFVIIPRSAKLACMGHFLCIPWVTDPVVVLCGIVACFSLEGKDIWSLSADTKQHLKRSSREDSRCMSSPQGLEGEGLKSQKVKYLNLL